MSTSDLLPLEQYLEHYSNQTNYFPTICKDYFGRYIQIKQYLATHVYPLIHAGTSAEDNGVYTDHSVDHFNAVIKYLGLLVGIENKHIKGQVEFSLKPYEVFITLVSILLHDAGNIFGRKGHEKHPLRIFESMGEALYLDTFEARIIGKIAQAHGGKVKNSQGVETNDTIFKLKEIDDFGGYEIRPRLLAALVRFADEICEDRSRAAKYLLIHEALPEFSQIYHKYAYSISSVKVDLLSKRVSLKIDLLKKDVEKKYGKGTKDNIEYIYLIDEINARLEKAFRELCYCKNYMIEVCPIIRIRAEITIHLEDDEITESFDLEQSGYPSESFSFSRNHPNWNGEDLSQRVQGGN